MLNAIPIGTVCPFSGQVAPFNGSANKIWDGSSCKSQQPTPGALADAPLNYLEAQGWMLCDGRYLSPASFPELYAVIGTLYGMTGQGSDLQFQIPDYRGLFLRGFDAGAGMDPNAGDRTSPTGASTSKNVVGSLQCGALQDHTHLYDVVNVSGVSNPGNAAGTASTSKSTTSPESPALIAPETRPKNIAVNYIIKFR